MLILDKVFKDNRNIIECVKSDLYFRGYSYIKEVYKQVSIITTTYNEYVIKFDREECEICHDYYEGPYYICYMTFINNLGTEVLKLSFSENQAMVILDSLSQFEDFNMADIIINLGSEDNAIYSLRIIREKGFYKCIIYRKDIFSESIKLKFTLNEEETNGLTDLIYSIYFSYLIDVDCNFSGECDISLLESIYNKVIDQDNYK